MNGYLTENDMNDEMRKQPGGVASYDSLEEHLADNVQQFNNVNTNINDLTANQINLKRKLRMGVRV